MRPSVPPVGFCELTHFFPALLHLFDNLAHFFPVVGLVGHNQLVQQAFVLFGLFDGL
jgi:hypothetical protein